MAANISTNVGSFVDPSKPLRDFFDQVSDKYNKKALAEQAAEERALERDISNQRYENEQARLFRNDLYQKQRDQVADQFRQSQENRAIAEENRLQAEADFKKQERERLEGIRTKLESYDNGLSYSDIETYAPDLAGKISNAGNFKAVDKQLDIAGRLFSGDASPETITSYLDAMEVQRGEKLTPAQRWEMTGVVQSLVDEVSTADNTQEAMQQAYDKLGLSELQKNKASFVDNAVNQLTKEEAKFLHTERMVKQGIPRTQAAAQAEAIVNNNFRRESIKDIEARRAASATAANNYAKETREAYKEYAKLQLDIIDKISSGSYKKSSGDPAKDIQAILKETSIHSNIDTDEQDLLVARYKELLPEYGADAAMAATLYSFRPGTIDDEIRPLAEAVQFAADIKDMKNPTGQNGALAATAKKRLEEVISKDYLMPSKPQTANMEAWRAGRWGNRLQLPVLKSDAYGVNTRNPFGTQQQRMLDEQNAGFTDAEVAGTDNSVQSNTSRVELTPEVKKTAGQELFNIVYPNPTNRQIAQNRSRTLDRVVDNYLETGVIPSQLQDNKEAVSLLQNLKSPDVIKKELADEKERKAKAKSLPFVLTNELNINKPAATRIIHDYRYKGILDPRLEKDPEALKAILEAYGPRD